MDPDIPYAVIKTTKMEKMRAEKTGLCFWGVVPTFYIDVAFRDLLDEDQAPTPACFIKTIAPTRGMNATEIIRAYLEVHKEVPAGELARMFIEGRHTLSLSQFTSMFRSREKIHEYGISTYNGNCTFLKDRHGRIQQALLRRRGETWSADLFRPEAPLLWYPSDRFFIREENIPELTV